MHIHIACSSGPQVSNATEIFSKTRPIKVHFVVLSEQIGCSGVTRLRLSGKTGGPAPIWLSWERALPRKGDDRNGEGTALVNPDGPAS